MMLNKWLWYHVWCHVMPCEMWEIKLYVIVNSGNSLDGFHIKRDYPQLYISHIQ